VYPENGSRGANLGSLKKTAREKPLGGGEKETTGGIAISLRGGEQKIPSVWWVEITKNGKKSSTRNSVSAQRFRGPARKQRALELPVPHSRARKKADRKRRPG